MCVRACVSSFVCELVCVYVHSCVSLFVRVCVYVNVCECACV